MSSTPTWPKSGTTHAGYAYAHPTSAQLTAGTGCSCSPFVKDPQAPTLPTPCARDGRGRGYQHSSLPTLLEPGGIWTGLLPAPTATAYGSNRPTPSEATRRPSRGRLAGLLATPTVTDSRSSANTTAGRTAAATGHAGRTLTNADRLLPTPRASDTGTAGRRAGAGFRPPLSQVLLPSPRATDGLKGSPGQRGSRGDLTLPSAAISVGDPTQDPTPAPAPAAAFGVADKSRWGGYATAVARWELLLGHRVPEPTQLGQHGRPVLAPLFVEWLMGLNPGWVTDLPLPRTAALRVLGNGVMTQQAAQALRLLLCPHRWAADPPRAELPGQPNEPA